MSALPAADKNPCVYLIDDDDSILKALSRLLRAAGFDVEAYDSARNFLAQHDPGAPGCAVLDVGMAGLDGLALQEALVSGDMPRPVVFLTGCDDVPTSVRAMKAGAIDYLTKPVQDDLLIRAVEAALAFDHAARQRKKMLDGLYVRYTALTPR